MSSSKSHFEICYVSCWAALEATFQLASGLGSMVLNPISSVDHPGQISHSMVVCIKSSARPNLTFFTCLEYRVIKKNYNKIIRNNFYIFCRK